MTYRRQHILTGALSRDSLRAAITGIRRRLPFEMPALVLLHDHLHCIWTLPLDDDDFPERWRQIKGRFSYEYLSARGRDWDVTARQKREGRAGVWQPRYWEHRIRDDDDYLRHRDYIHLNPVKHGYVERPGDWPWSSFHRHVKMGWLDPTWPGTSPVALPDVAEE